MNIEAFVTGGLEDFLGHFVCPGIGVSILRINVQETVTVIDCPVDYSENVRLIEDLGNVVGCL